MRARSTGDGSEGQQFPETDLVKPALHDHGSPDHEHRHPQTIGRSDVRICIDIDALDLAQYGSDKIFCRMAEVAALAGEELWTNCRGGSFGGSSRRLRRPRWPPGTFWNGMMGA